MPIYYITGLPGCGKSTFVTNVKRRCNIKTSIITKEILDKTVTRKKRLGFTTKMNDNGYIQERKIAIDESIWKPTSSYNIKFSHYYINLDKIKDVAKEIKKLYKKSKILIIDEIGSMQLLSKEYYEAIKDIVEKNDPNKIIIFCISIGLTYKVPTRHKQLYQKIKKNFEGVFLPHIRGEGWTEEMIKYYDKELNNFCDKINNINKK